jgi:16S rRNA (adenine(1408)-N(1))-methyltransferase
VIDIGTGDGRFVTASAKAAPRKFFIGVDANVKPLEKPSMKATRKSSKGGLPNALFVQASVEDLPEEFDGLANKIHINFPWGSLLKAIATGDSSVLDSLRRICASEALLEIVIGIDPERDRSEVERLGLSGLLDDHIKTRLLPKYSNAGFTNVESRTLMPTEWRKIETSWARKLQGEGRVVRRLIFRAT